MEEINQNSQTFLDFNLDILKPNNEYDLQEIIKHCYKKDLPIELRENWNISIQRYLKKNNLN